MGHSLNDENELTRFWQFFADSPELKRQQNGFNGNIVVLNVLYKFAHCVPENTRWAVTVGAQRLKGVVTDLSF